MFEKFTVIDLIKTRSASVCTFTGNVVKFNIQTAQELHFPEYIQFLIEPKSKQFAIRACKEDAPNAVRFSKPEGEPESAGQNQQRHGGGSGQKTDGLECRG